QREELKHVVMERACTRARSKVGTVITTTNTRARLRSIRLKSGLKSFRKALQCRRNVEDTPVQRIGRTPIRCVFHVAEDNRNRLNSGRLIRRIHTAEPMKIELRRNILTVERVLQRNFATILE